MTSELPKVVPYKLFPWQHSRSNTYIGNEQIKTKKYNRKCKKYDRMEYYTIRKNVEYKMNENINLFIKLVRFKELTCLI